MILAKVEDLFEVKYGVNLELINLRQCSRQTEGAINFVSRTEKNNGVSASVMRENGIQPNPPMTISVAGGGSVLSTFLQKHEYYSGRDVYILIPRQHYSEAELLFFVFCITQNKYRYNYGRQANKTLKELLIPRTVPTGWQVPRPQDLNNLNRKPLLSERFELDTTNWKFFNLLDYFEISASRDELLDELNMGGLTPYITSSDSNNGVTAYVIEKPTNLPGTITANRGGSVGYFFFQPHPYKATPVDVRILTPKFNINTYIGLFLRTVLQLEKYRFNYSRKMGTDRLSYFKIKLPSKEGEPDWQYMEAFIKTLPYSANI